MVPHLTTALTGPLLELERKFLESSPQIEHWLRGQWQEYTPPFYSSCDLRNSGFKLAPVDTNLYPRWLQQPESGVPAALRAGGDECHRKILSRRRAACCSFRKTTRATSSTCRTSRNWSISCARPASISASARCCRKSTSRRRSICRMAVNCCLSPWFAKATAWVSMVSNLVPYCSTTTSRPASPTILKNLHDQVVLPPLHAGWAVRRKSNHFAAYDQVANDFAKEIGIDPWRINPAFSVCRSSINFHERQGEECLASQRRRRAR